MTYREKLELYSQGKLNEQQKTEIERELEKQEALTDYLFEHQAPPGMDELFDEASPFDAKAESAESTSAAVIKDDSEAVAKQINRSIRKAFIKTGVIAVVIALILTLFVVFALPHIVSAFYYDPGKVIGTDENDTKIEQLERDMSVFAELSIPELGPNITVGTDSFGYGNYSYFIDGVSLVDPRGSDSTVKKNLTGNIKRNKFICYNYEEIGQFLDDYHDVSQNTSNLETMNETDLYYAFVDLKELVPYEQFYEDYIVDGDGYGTDRSWVWCAVKVNEDESTNGYLNRGFYATTNGQFAQYGFDADTYPMLAWEEDSEELDTEAKAKQHFTSMLSYILDNEKYNSLSFQLEPAVEKSEKEYVEGHGVNIYGFVYVSDKAHIDKIAKAKGVNKVYVDKAL